MNNSASELKKQHKFTDFLYWNLVMAVPFVTGCVAIIGYSMLYFIIYIIISLTGIIMIYKFYCSHCPHYTRKGGITKCMFFWGVPKFFKPNPGPLSILDLSATFLAAAVIIVFPVYWLILEPGLMVIYVLAWAAFLFTVRRNECRRCIYFNCPANAVPENIKKNSG